MIKWPEDLIEDIARRRCVVFLGAGISAGCKNDAGRQPRTWKDFLIHLANNEVTRPNKHIKTLINKQDYLTACEVIKKSVGIDRFNVLISDEFLTPGYKHSEIQEAIFKLDSRIVATPNFDKIYETYANGQAFGSIRIIHQYDEDVSEAVRRDHRLILKVHGTIDTPQKMIFTRKEYAKARQSYRSFYSVLEALALTHTFFFLGCSVNDPDIRLLLEDNYFRHPAGRPHIMVLPKDEMHSDILTVIEETMNVKVLLYGKGNDHRELLISVKELTELVDDKRDQLRKNSNW
jgi:hypothetical protein